MEHPVEADEGDEAEEHQCEAQQRRHLQGEARQQPAHVLRGHSASVQCVAISSAMRLAVSGSHDGTAALYSNPHPDH